MHIELSKVLTPRNGIIFAVVLVLLALGYFANWSNVSTVTATVHNLDTYTEITHRKKSSGGRSTTRTTKNLVFTNKGTFEDTTDLLRGKMGVSILLCS